MGVTVPAVVKSVMGKTPDIFRVHMAGPVESKPVKQQSVFSTLMQKTYAARLQWSISLASWQGM
ncbi:hypothetical protein NL364_31715, partial [Klebsiella pneumoniae]|nr:hypothetical protein [Klebsiella pneumoniae]